MAITYITCTAFKKALFDGEIDFSADTTDTFKIALYTSNSSLNSSTVAYTTTNEVASGGGYTTGGETLVVTPPITSGSVVYIDFTDVTWSTASFTARAALIYKEGGANTAIAVIDFGADVSVTAGDLAIAFPTASASSAIIRMV